MGNTRYQIKWVTMPNGMLSTDHTNMNTHLCASIVLLIPLSFDNCWEYTMTWTSDGLRWMQCRVAQMWIKPFNSESTPQFSEFNVEFKWNSPELTFSIIFSKMENIYVNINHHKLTWNETERNRELLGGLCRHVKHLLCSYSQQNISFLGMSTTTIRYPARHNHKSFWRYIIWWNEQQPLNGLVPRFEFI